MSGWVVEDNNVRLRYDFSVYIVSYFLKFYFEQCKTPSLPSGIVKISHGKYKAILTAMYDDDIACTQKLLNHNHISSSANIVLYNGQPINLLKAAIATQQIDVAKMLIYTYSVDFYSASATVVDSVFCTVPQSFAIELLKCAGIRQSLKFESMNSATLLHLTTMYNCFDIYCLLLDYKLQGYRCQYN